LLLNALTGGGYFYHMYTIHDLPWFSGRFMEFLRGFVAAYGILIILGIAAILAGAMSWLIGRVRSRSGYEAANEPLLLLLYAGMGAGTRANCWTLSRASSSPR